MIEQTPPVAEILSQLEARYGRPEPGPAGDSMDELISIVLSQHTSDSNTARAFASLKARFPKWEDLASAEVNQVVDAIRAGGLANQKGPRIQAILREVRQRTGGYDVSFLAELPVREATAWLESLPGVGPKTATCLLLFGLGMPAFPVDTHVHRVSRRLGLIPDRTTAEQAHDLLADRIESAEYYRAHMLFIRHGREICQARRPRCERCPVVHLCPSAALFLTDHKEAHGNQADGSLPRSPR
jgi:endonuclease-3